MTYLRLRYWIVGAGMLVCFFAPNNSFGTGPEEVVYEFPPHFKGWVLIQWEDPACAALPSKPGSIHIPIPESGCACTSDLPLFGFRPTRYERIHLDGTKEVLLSRLGDDSSDIRSHITGMGAFQGGSPATLARSIFCGQ